MLHQLHAQPRGRRGQRRVYLLRLAEPLVYDDPEYIDDMGEDTMAILYPDIGSFRDAYNRSAYRNLDQDTLTYVNSLWETLKIN